MFGRFAAHIQEEVRAANLTAAAAAVMAQELQDAEDKKELPNWAIVLIAVLGCVGLCCLLSVCVLVSKEKAGKPMFVNLDNAPASKGASSTKARARARVTRTLAAPLLPLTLPTPLPAQAGRQQRLGDYGVCEGRCRSLPSQCAGG